MTALHISVIVSRRTQFLESKLLTVDETFDDPHQALAYRAELEHWLTQIPDPLTAGQPKPQPVDPTTLLALELPAILGGRDPRLFTEFYEDRESEAALIERRPYDGERLAA